MIAIAGMKAVNPHPSVRKRLLRPCSCLSSSFLPTPPLYPSPPTHPRSRLSDVSPYRPVNGSIPTEIPLKPRRNKLKAVKENRIPSVSQSFSQEYVQNQGKRDQMSRRPSQSPILVPVSLSDIKERGKADMRKGSFSYKQAFPSSEDYNSVPIIRLNAQSIATESDTQTARGPRSASPALTARSRRFQQLSRHYRLDRKALQRQVSVICRSTMTLQRQGKRRYATPERLPSVIFMADLEGITRISDYSER